MIKKIKLTKAGGVPGTGMLNSVISFFLSYFSAFIIFIMFSASFLLFFGDCKEEKVAEAKRYLRQSLWFLSEDLVVMVNGCGLQICGAACWLFLLWIVCHHSPA